jgi:hypothetical protein
MPASQPSSSVVPILGRAAAALDEADIAAYAWLRAFVAGGMDGDRTLFRRRYSAYYRLDRAGLSRRFKDTYFELLFAYRPTSEPDPYTPLLCALRRYKRRPAGAPATSSPLFAASFATKLVAIHEEHRPIFDSHVHAFFGIGFPRLGPFEHRAALFVRHLEVIRSAYEEWQHCPSVAAIIETVRARHPALATTHPVRIADFLVWTATALAKAGGRE